MNDPRTTAQRQKDSAHPGAIRAREAAQADAKDMIVNGAAVVIDPTGKVIKNRYGPTGRVLHLLPECTHELRPLHTGGKWCGDCMRLDYRP